MIQFTNFFHSLLYSQNTQETTSLTLPNNQGLTENEFCTHPYFQYTKEKKNVFQLLKQLLQEANFTKTYSDFFENITKDYWFELYEQKPQQLALLAIIAYFEKHIDEEELFIIHLVSYAIVEKREKKNVDNVEFGMLTKQNGANYLEESGYPLFAINHYPKPILKNVCSQDTLSMAQKDFLSSLDKISCLKRTTIEYSIKDFSLTEDRDKPYSCEQKVYFDTTWRIGYKNIIENKGTIVLLPPMLSINVCRLACSNPTLEATKHHFMFGYTPDNQLLLNGARIISIPSVLFDVPYVHDYKKGSPGFQIYFHDVCYHLVLDMNNPHTDDLIRIANEIKFLAKVQIPTPLKKFLDLISSLLIDREAIQYRYHSSTEVFFDFIQYVLNEAFQIVMNEASIEEKYQLESFAYDKWIKMVFIPLLHRSLNESKNSCFFALTSEEIAANIKYNSSN